MVPDDSDAIEIARSLLPVWVPWTRIVVLPSLALAFTCLFGWIALKIAERKSIRETHWTERARHHVTFLAGMRLSSLSAVVFFSYLALAFDDPMSVAPSSVVAAACLVGIYVGSLATRTLAARRLRGLQPSLRLWIRENLGMLIFLQSPIYLAIAMLLFLPGRLGRWGMTMAILGVDVLVFLGIGGGLLVLRRLALARNLVAEPARKAVESSGIATHALLRVDLPAANALALPWLRSIAVTERALDLLDESQLASILRHELAHLDEGLAMRIARLAPVVVLAVGALGNPLSAGMGSSRYLALLGGLVFLAWVVRRVSRRYEERADRAGAGESGESPAYARALERLYQSNLQPAVVRKRTLHPSLYDRMLSAGVQPEFERPAPPPSLPMYVGVMMGVVLGVPLGLLRSLTNPREEARGSEPDVLVALAVGSETAMRLTDLARIRSDADDLRSAVAFYRAASYLDRRSPYPVAELAIVLSDMDRCSEASVALEEALRRAGSVQVEQNLSSTLKDAERGIDDCHARTGSPASK